MVKKEQIRKPLLSLHFLRKVCLLMEKIVLLLAKELNIKPAQAEAALQLLDSLYRPVS